MAKEWILNSVMNRFQLNFKRNVGAVSEEIRKCSPRTLEEWQEYYFKDVKNKAHIETLGQKLYVKITEVVLSEVAEITEQDCIDYMFNLVINRTYDGYCTEIHTIYGQLQEQIGYKIESAPDKWDRIYNVDFFIKIKEKFLGIQVKPVSDVSHIQQIYKERSLQAKSHTLFKKKFGGEVFYVYSIKMDGKKMIHNTDVVCKIQQEIKRLEEVGE